MLPILIGSKALSYHGFNIDPNDIDIIVDVKYAEYISGKCDQKEGNMLFFDDTKIDIMVCDDDNNPNSYILKICNQYFADNKQIFFRDFEAIVPPLEILYAIKKSHIHRIRNLTPSNMLNLQIWQRHMNFYDMMRMKLGYERMDIILYGNDKYGTPILFDDSNDIVNVVRKIFVTKFDNINNTIGDTIVSMEKSNDDFFKDNVERTIDHDDLHKKVALKFRQTDKLLYDNYKLDVDQVNLDLHKFLAADPNERIQCLREEAMVLLMERKWIPEIMKCHVTTQTPYLDINISQKKLEMHEIIAHFITNLCGQGHAWLRQYCLDHYKILSNVDSYDYVEMFTIVSEITNVKLVTIREMFDPINLHQFINGTLQIKNFIDLSSKLVVNTKKITNITSGNHVIFHVLGIDVKDFDTCNTIVFRSNNDYSNYHEFIKFLTGTDFRTNIVLYEIINSNSVIMLNASNGIGMHVVDQFTDIPPKITLFYCDINKHSKYNVDFNGECYDIINNTKIEKFMLDYSTRYQRYYYYSEDEDDCGWKNRNFVKKAKYLSSYGNAPGCISNFLEYIGRYVINLEYDSYVRNYDTKSSSYSANGSSYSDYSD